MNVVVTGSIAYDYLMFFAGEFAEHLLEQQLRSLSVSFLVDSLRRERGGTAPNIAYTMALLKGQPMVMATAGEDFGSYREWLEQHGVNTSAIKEIEGEYCASFFANIDEVQNQIGAFYAGAMAHAGELSFAQHAPDAELAIISPNEPGAMRRYVEECKALDIAYIYDPSQQTIRLTADDLVEGIDGCYLLTVNEYELSMIEEKTGLDEDEILRRAEGLLVTRGKEGSQIIVDGDYVEIPPVPPHEVAEPTGAGDGFRGGLLRGIQLGLPWSICGRMGALAATYVLENMGTQNHRYTPAEFVARYRQHFDDEGALDVLLAPETSAVAQ
ncbi:MAG TPA: carbohydrate kinase family protein [Candidatus Sulfomarinibacteraceae bacterium]|nr:carbohydrate kinase family protein [Candidatus Sulfomarinibacteraceae bacterium]